MADCVTSLGGMRARGRAVGRRLLLLVQPEVPGRAARHLAGVALAAGAGADRARAPRRCPSASTSTCSKYWIDRPAVYHHTMPIPQYYALYEGLRLTLEEGLEARWQRHADAGAHLQAGLRERGFDLLADPRYQLPQLTAVCVPDGIDGKACSTAVGASTAIEVGGGLGPDRPADLADRHDGHQRQHRDRRPPARGVRLGDRAAAHGARQRGTPDGRPRPPSPQRAGGARLEHARARKGARAGRRRRLPRPRGRGCPR